jgi:hypothetical protein
MWTPKQLLSPKSVKALQRSKQFSPLMIEFLGWSNGRARALNNSPNIVRAALTMLRDGDDNQTTHEWIRKFIERKENSVKPHMPTTHTEAARAFGQLESLLDEYKTQDEALAEETDFQQDQLDGE